ERKEQFASTWVAGQLNPLPRPLLIAIGRDVAIVNHTQPAVGDHVDVVANTIDRSIAQQHAEGTRVGATKRVIVLHAQAVLVRGEVGIGAAMLVAIVAGKHRFVVAKVVGGATRGIGAIVALGALVLFAHHKRLR